MQATETMLERAALYATRKGELSAAERLLERLGVLCFGIESVSCADRSIDYVNMGETYTPTIVQEGETFSVSSWGGWYEGAEQEHCEQEGAIRCGYCGEFTPCAEEWSETVCEHCGRYVDSGALPEKETEDGEDD
ncbi:MAG: hypothetical protein ACYC35_00350 [Pirellulales bacterium]